MFDKTKDVCPYVARECVKERCHAWMQIVKRNDMTGESSTQDVCGLTYQTHIMIEMLTHLRHNEAQAQQMIQMQNSHNEAVRVVLQREREIELERLRDVSETDPRIRLLGR